MTFKIKKPKEKRKKFRSVYQKLYAVDYDLTNGEGFETFEIFKTKKEAENFNKKVKGKLWKADFNNDLVFKENGKLNYDDRAGLYKNRKELK